MAALQIVEAGPGRLTETSLRSALMAVLAFAQGVRWIATSSSRAPVI
ncbi:hypothetical protein [Chelatococcus reniformis]|nr:hypothetical protein [Chelatococcus reniformis]